jgi:hypothetical protein
LLPNAFAFAAPWNERAVCIGNPIDIGIGCGEERFNVAAFERVVERLHEFNIIHHHRLPLSVRCIIARELASQTSGGCLSKMDLATSGSVKQRTENLGAISFFASVGWATWGPSVITD